MPRIHDSLFLPSKSRSRRALFGLGFGAALLFAMAPATGPHIGELEGSVQIGTGEPPAWRPAQVGEPVSAGDLIRTGHAARAELVLGTRKVRLYANSMLSIPASAFGSAGPDRIEVVRGRSLFDVLRRDEEKGFLVRAREVVVSVKGTRFLVTVAEGESQVSVFRGHVGVRPLGDSSGHETLVRPGFFATAVGDAPIELGLSALEDPWDAWSTGETPSWEASAAAESEREAVQEAVREAASDALPAKPDLDAQDIGRDKRGRGRNEPTRTDLDLEKRERLGDFEREMDGGSAGGGNRDLITDPIDTGLDGTIDKADSDSHNSTFGKH